jgi:hypothetical protein
MTNEHVVEECPRFGLRRDELRSLLGLGDEYPVATLFESDPVSEIFVDYCVYFIRTIELFNS